jgi:membrane peptidoglycan carboxypeptidase
MSKSVTPSQTSQLRLAMQMVIYIVLAGLVAALVVLPVVGGAGLTTRNGVRSFQSLPADITEVPLPQQNTIVDAKNHVIASLFSQNRIEVPLNQISPLLQQAVISIEDQRFLQHSGIDFKGTLRAAFSTGSGSQVQGGSTITQQYVKQLLLAAATTPEEQRAAVEQSIGRKIREARYALALETTLNKRDILKGYLNIAYFGAGAYGAESASRRYFSVSASELTLTQAATLAGLVQNPSRFDPTRFPERAEVRRNEVLQSMARAGYISAADAQVAARRPLLDDLRPAAIPNGSLLL